MGVALFNIVGEALCSRPSVGKRAGKPAELTSSTPRKEENHSYAELVDPENTALIKTNGHTQRWMAATSYSINGQARRIPPSVPILVPVP